MNGDIASSVLTLVVLLICSFFFSGSETSITAAGRAKLLALADMYPNNRKSILWLLGNTQDVLAATLVGNNLVNIAASSVTTSLFLKMLGKDGPIVAVLITTTVIVIFCEILPKSIAISKADSMLLLIIGPLRLFSRVFYPIIRLTTMIIDLMGRAMGLSLGVGGAFTSREEIEHMVKESSASGALEEEESKMIHGIISFEETRVSEVMVPRTDITALPETATVGEAAEVFRTSGHSRMPVYSKDIDHVEGMVYVKDLLLSLVAGNVDTLICDLKRKSMFVPETMKIAELFGTMKRARMHMAIVVDEYGGTAGLLTMEDLLEEIVGEIQDEYDQEVAPITREQDGSYVVQGHVHLEDLSDALDYPFEAEDVDTVGGFTLDIFGGFPKEGQEICYGPWLIRVTDVEAHRVKQVSIMKFEDTETAEPEVEK